MTTELGTLVKVDAKSVFSGGNAPLTQWLAQNLDVVGAALEMDLEPAAGGSGGPGADGDVVARDARRDRIVIFCSQVSASDDHQLGRLITLAGDNSAHSVVWVGPELRRSHRQALRWFNSQSPEDGIKFYALGLELFRVDNSKPGVAIRLLEGPDEPSDPDSLSRERNGHFTSAGGGHTPEFARESADAAELANGISRNGAHGGAESLPPAEAAPMRDEPTPSVPHVRPDHSSPAPATPDEPAGRETPQDATAPQQAPDREAGGERPAPAANDQQEAYRKFFQRMVDELQQKYRLTEARPAQAQNWYSLPSSVSGIIYSIWFSGNGRIRAELYIDVGDREVNRDIFARMQGHAPEIENEYGTRLDWDASQGGRAYTVSTSLPGKIDDTPETLEKNLKWATTKLVAFKEVFGRRLPLILRSIGPKSAGASRPSAAAARSRP